MSDTSKSDGPIPKIIFKPIDLLYALLLGIAIYFFEVGNPELPDETQILLVIFVIILIIVFYARRYGKSTESMLEAFGQKNSFQAKEFSIDEVIGENKIDLFRCQGRPRINSYWSKEGIAFYYFGWPAVLGKDYDTGNQQDIPIWFFVFDISLEKELPALSIFSQKDSRKFKIVHHMPHASMESNEFNRKYLLYTDNAKNAYDILDPNMMNILLSEKQEFNYEISRKRLLVYRCGKAGSEQLVENMYAQAQRVAARLNR